MANVSNAWLLPLDATHRVAVSELAMVEYIITPQLYDIPLTPTYCCNVISWRDKFIPVMRVNMLLDLPNVPSVHHLAIVAYQHAPRTPLQYGAIVLNNSPFRISVDDRQACGMPKYIGAGLRPGVLSCFTYNDAKIPVFDTSYLFSQTLRENLKLREAA